MSITRTTNPGDFGEKVAQQILSAIPPEFPFLHQLLSDRILTVGEKIQADASLNTEAEVIDLITELRNATDKAILLSLMDRLDLDTDKLDDQYGENLYDRIYKSSPPALKIQLEDNREDVIGKIKDYTLAQVADLAANVIIAVETDSRKLGVAMGELGLSTDTDDVNEFFGAYQYGRIISKDPFLQPYFDPALVVPALGANEDLKGNKEVDDLVADVKKAITNKKEDLAGALAELGITDPAVAVKLFGNTQYDRLTIPPYLQTYVDRDAVSAALGRDPNVHGDADVDLALARINDAIENEFDHLDDALKDFGIVADAGLMFGNFHIDRILANPGLLDPIVAEHPLLLKHLTDNHDVIRDALGSNLMLHNTADVNLLFQNFIDALSVNFAGVGAAMQDLGLDPANAAHVFGEFQYDRILKDYPELAPLFTARNTFVIDAIANSTANDNGEVNVLVQELTNAVAADDIPRLQTAMRAVGLDDADDDAVKSLYRELKFKELLVAAAGRPELIAALKDKKPDVMQNIDPSKPNIIWGLLDAVMDAKTEKDVIQALVNLDLDPAKARTIFSENRQARHNIFAGPAAAATSARTESDVKFRNEFLQEFVLAKSGDKADRYKRINDFLTLLWKKSHATEKNPNPDLDFIREKEKKCDDIKYDLLRYRQILINIRDDHTAGMVPVTADDEYKALFKDLQKKYGANFLAKITEALKEVDGYIDMADRVLNKIQPLLAPGFKPDKIAYASDLFPIEKAVHSGNDRKVAIAEAEKYLGGTSPSIKSSGSAPSFTGLLAGHRPLDDVKIKGHDPAHSIVVVPVTITTPPKAGLPAVDTQTVSVREYNSTTKSARVSMYGDLDSAALKAEKPIFKGGPTPGMCELVARNIQMLIAVGLAPGDKVAINPGTPRKLTDAAILNALLYCDLKGLVPDTSHPVVRQIAKQVTSGNKKDFAEYWKKEHPDDFSLSKEQKVEAKSEPISPKHP